MKILLAGTLAASLALGADAAATTALAVRIEVYNYAKVSDATLRQAEHEATQILREIEVGTTWRHCSVTPVAPAHDVCAGAGTYAVFVIRLLSNTMAARYPAPATVCGLTLLPEGGEFGMYANVFADRIPESTADPDLRPLLIGNVIAHEIGHLIVGRQHSAAGLMRNPWTVADLRLIPRGGLRFSRDEANGIRDRLLARARSAELSSGRAPEVTETALRTELSGRGDAPRWSAEP